MAGGSATTASMLDEVAASEGIQVRSDDMILARTRHLGPLHQLASAADRAAKTEEW
jgi:hypothetical protein